MSERALIVAGGGTGGHVLAGIAIADEWKKRGVGPVRFVGARGGIEENLVPRAGYALSLLGLGSLKGVSILKKLRTLLLLPWALLRSAIWIWQWRPRAVIGVGGYASGPLVLMARLVGWPLGIRVAILEQNAAPGFTNRVLGWFSARVFSAFPGLERVFGAGKTVVSGNPVRSSMQVLAPAPRRPFTVFIFGGSQGAQAINTLVIDALPLLDDVKNELQFIHQTGERDFERVLSAHRAAGWSSRVEKFIYDMPECYRKASLLICRAGSSTLSEVAAVGRAAILIPFPFATDNHQEANARVFVDAGAAVLLRQKDANAVDLARLIRAYLRDPAPIERMEKAVRAFYRANSSRDVVDFLAGGR